MTNENITYQENQLAQKYEGASLTYETAGIKVKVTARSEEEKRKIAEIVDIVRSRREGRGGKSTLQDVSFAIQSAGLGERIRQDFGKKAKAKKLESVIGVATSIGIGIVASNPRYPEFATALYALAALGGIGSIYSYLNTWLAESDVNETFRT